MAAESHTLCPDFKTPTGTPVRTQRKDAAAIPPEISITETPVRTQRNDAPSIPPEIRITCVLPAEKEEENANPKSKETEEKEQEGGTRKGNESSHSDLKPAPVELFPENDDNSDSKFVHQDDSFLSDGDASEQQPAFLVPETVPPPPPVELVPNLLAAESRNGEEKGKEGQAEEEEAIPEAEQVPEGALVLSGDEEDDDGFVLIGDDALLSDNNLSGSYDFIGVNQSNHNTRR